MVRKLQLDEKARISTAEDELLLLKIGRSKYEPTERVLNQSKNNGERYSILCSYYSIFHMYFEWALHKYFRKYRVVRAELKDGGTEWFLLGSRQLIYALNRVRICMQLLFKDKANPPAVPLVKKPSPKKEPSPSKPKSPKKPKKVKKPTPISHS